MSTRNGAERGYPDEVLLEEVRRVIDEHGDGETVSMAAFDAHSHIAAVTVRRRFDTWVAAIEAAGGTPSAHQRRSASATSVSTSYGLEHLDPEDVGLSPLGGEE